MGFAFAEENKDKVAEVGVANAANGTCVLPSAETIADASYPLSRGLYIYVNKAKAAANPAVKAYVDYYLADGTVSSVLETVPYVEPPGGQAGRLAHRLGSGQVARALLLDRPDASDVRPVLRSHAP